MRTQQDIGSLNEDLERLQRFILAQDNLLVITGAGISTVSGIGDY
jgi:NAD-dependent SIR2 family protein deacetylase